MAYTALNNVWYIFHEDNVDCILCHRVGRAHYMQLYNDANRRVDDYMGVGTFHVNPFAGSHYMFQNTGDHIEALLHTLTGTGHIQGCRCNAFQSCDHMEAFYSQIHDRDT